ncbi:MAG: hypothetical protein IT181_19305, partial [Acidobacteria bacterium]|nr:hypothetical protein [Acidobacteriota bacterium]
MRRLFVLTMALTGVVVPVSAQILPDDVSSLPWVVDGGWVSAAAAIGDTLFVGGWFHSVARRSDRIGPFGVFDAVTGTLVAADPSLGGYAVTAATDDGAGGWYVAGTLSAETYGGLIHVDASGRRLPFLPGLGSAYTGIWTLARAGTVLFVGGSFSTFGGQPRANLAAVDMTTGALLPWNPGTDGDVEEIALRGTQLFVGGRCQTVGGLPRASLASVDAWSGAVSSWAPAVTGAFFGVRALLVTDDRVYVGGDFSAVNGVARSGLAAVDPASGALLPFGPVLTGGVPLVESVALRGAELFIAGAFETAGGQPRRGLAALDAVTGVVTGWAPAVAGIARVVEVSGTQVFASGSLTAAGAPRRVVRLDAVTGVLADAWDPAPGGDVDVVVADGRRVFLGGRFATHRAVSVAGLTAFSLTDGSHVPMPAVGGAVFALAASGTTLYLGGNFAMVGALPRQAVAAIDVMSRAVLPFAPTPDWPGASPFGARVDALAVEGGTVFFGGQFTHVSGQPRAHVAAVDSVTGALRAFALPQLTTASTPGVRGLAVANGRLWIGGHIAHSSPARQWLLVADAVTGAVDPLDYALDGAVGTVVGDGASVYVGGAFTSAGGAARPGVLKIAAATGAMQPWPAATGFTFGFDIGTASGVVVTPALTTGPPPLTASLEALDAASGSRLPWAPLDGLGYRRAWGVGGGVVAAGPNYGRPPDSPALFQQRSATGAPSAVADFGVHVQGTLTTLRWTPGLQGAAPTAYRLEAGSAPGRSDLAR